LLENAFSLLLRIILVNVLFHNLEDNAFRESAKSVGQYFCIDFPYDRERATIFFLIKRYKRVIV
jgi:hypothetical protein